MTERRGREILPFGLLPESTITDLQEALSRNLDMFSHFPNAVRSGGRWRGRIKISLDENKQKIVIPYLRGVSTAIHVDTYGDPTHTELGKRTWVNFSVQYRNGEEFYLGQVIERGHSKDPKKELSYPVLTIRALRGNPYQHLIQALSTLQSRS